MKINEKMYAKVVAKWLTHYMCLANLIMMSFQNIVSCSECINPDIFSGISNSLVVIFIWKLKSSLTSICQIETLFPEKSAFLPLCSLGGEDVHRICANQKPSSRPCLLPSQLLYQ